MASNPDRWRYVFESVYQYGLVTAPAAGATIVDSGALVAGIYDITINASYGGTADVIDNMALFLGDKKVGVLPIVPVANSAPIPVELFGKRVLQGQHLIVQAIAAGGVGTVYRAVITATLVSTQYRG